MAPRFIKPDALTILPKVFAHQGRNVLAVSVFAGFVLDGEPRLLDEGDLWDAASASLSRDQVLDQGMPKPGAEFLLAGAVFAEGGREAPMVQATVRVGGLAKTIYAFGDRVWTETLGLGRRMSDPSPFNRMDLSWARAFGGSDYPDNPDGLGLHLARISSGRTIQPLPNFEYPDSLITAPADRPRPAGFGPLGLTWPKRLANLGRFDDRWLRDVWPGLPDDFDFRAFNLAPADQRIQGFFKGDETVVLLHLHPEQPRIETRLPALRLRLFINRHNKNDEVFEELPARLDTIWLFPHLRTGVLIWRGVSQVGDDEAAELSHVVACPEPMIEPPRPAEVYRAMIGQGPPEETPAEPPEAPEVAPRAEAPEPSPGEPYELSEEMKNAWAGLAAKAEEIKAREAEFEAKLKSIGLDPSLVPEPPSGVVTPPRPDLPPSLDPLERLKRIKAHTEILEADLDNRLKSIGLDPSLIPEPDPRAGSVMSPQDLIAALESIGMEDKEGLLDEMREMLLAKETIGRLRAERPPLPEPEVEAEAESASEVEPPSGALTRQQVIDGHAAGRSFAGLNLTGLDLSGCELAGLDLKGAVLENVSFSGADLSGADLRDAILTGADLSQARLAGASISAAAASGTKWIAADLHQADLSQALLNGSDLTGADLRDAVLDRADCSKATLSGIKGIGLRARRTQFYRADLSAADVRETEMTGADLTGSKMDGANFSGAGMRDARLADSKGPGALFKDADLRSSRVAGRTDLSGVDFTQADLSGVYWEDADLSGADFTRANLSQASLTRCSLRQASLTKAQADRADLSNSNLDQADCRFLNLFQGSLRKADLRRTDLRSSNLFAVDLYQSIHDKTLLDGANLNRTVLTLWRDKEASK